MTIRFHPHALARTVEGGATESEVAAAIEHGERFPVRFGRVGYRRTCPTSGTWRGRPFTTKHLEVYAVEEGGRLAGNHRHRQVFLVLEAPRYAADIRPAP